MVFPGVGGITYNVRVGDLAVGWMADHVEPGVSIRNKEKEDRFPHGPNYALNVLSCVGNEAVVVTGDAKGENGVVTGKHGGIEHVLVDVLRQPCDPAVQVTDAGGEVDGPIFPLPRLRSGCFAITLALSPILCSIRAVRLRIGVTEWGADRRLAAAMRCAPGRVAVVYGPGSARLA